MSQGKTYHLKPLFRMLNRLYFEGRLRCRLEWGRVRSSHVRRTRQLGRYEPRKNRIVLNRVLDQTQVPLYVIASVMHHEMCHIAIPAKKRKDRLLYHSRAFRDREREFEEFQKAKSWIKANRKFLFQPPKNYLKGSSRGKTRQLRLFC